MARKRSTRRWLDPSKSIVRQVTRLSEPDYAALAHLSLSYIRDASRLCGGGLVVYGAFLCTRPQAPRAVDLMIGAC